METDQFNDLLERMPKIAEAVNAFDSSEVQREAFAVLIAATGPLPERHSTKTAPTAPTPSQPPAGDPTPSEVEDEIPGIAIREGDGTIKFTIRDIKAKNAKDAGIRLTLVAAYVHERLTGNPEISRKDILNPLLKSWRAYDGNIRGAISKHRGILQGAGRDLIKLDTHARNEAEDIIKQMEDEEYSGTWKPSDGGKRRRRKLTSGDSEPSEDA